MGRSGTVYKKTEPTLYIMRGLPGSGKDAAVNTLLKFIPQTIVIAAQDFVDEHNRSYAEFPHLKERARYARLADCFRHMAAQASPIVVNDEHIEHWEYAPYQEMAKHFKYQVAVIDLFDAGLTDMQLKCRCPDNVSAAFIALMRTMYEPNAL